MFLPRNPNHHGDNGSQSDGGKKKKKDSRSSSGDRRGRKDKESSDISRSRSANTSPTRGKKPVDMLSTVSEVRRTCTLHSCDYVIVSIATMHSVYMCRDETDVWYTCSSW